MIFKLSLTLSLKKKTQKQNGLTERHNLPNAPTVSRSIPTHISQRTSPHPQQSLTVASCAQTHTVYMVDVVFSVWKHKNN